MKGGDAMTMKGRWAAAGLALAMIGCGDGETIVELTVVETIPVAFDDMQGGVTEGATIELSDLRNEPAYSDVAKNLRCGSLDKAKSFIEIEALDVGAGATVLAYEVGVGAKGTASYTKLATFGGSVTDGEKVFLDSAKVTLDPSGLAELSRVVLSATPALAVQVTASVPGNLDDLQVALSLSIGFSSDAKGCP
jgi:hypothetical protein